MSLGYLKQRKTEAVFKFDNGVRIYHTGDKAIEKMVIGLSKDVSIFK